MCLARIFARQWLYAQLLLVLFLPGYFLNNVAFEVMGNQKPGPRPTKHDIALFPRLLRAWRRRSLRDFGRLLAYNVGLVASGKYEQANHAFDPAFDRRFNVETAGTEEPGFLTAEHDLKSHARGYEPVTEQMMRALLEMLPDTDLVSYSFIDFGSGKGRALFVAAEYPFRQIIGLEYSQELHEVASGNVATYRNPAQKCFHITPLCMDATAFRLPEYPLICFINNPFDESLIARTASNIDGSVRAFPRPCFIIYLHSYYPGPIDALSGWCRIHEGSSERSSYIIWQYAASTT